jgi:hypothetical protein
MRILCANHFIYFFLVLGLDASPQVSKPSPPPPGLPAAAGVYYRQHDTQWIKVDPAPKGDSKMKGMNVFLQTEGLAGLNMSFEYWGAYAALQIPEKRPVFLARGTGTAQAALIVRLTPKDHNRLVQTTSSDMTAENKGGFKKKDIRKVRTAVFSDGSFSITPIEDLQPGEYILVFGNANNAFDFGISPAKK